MRKRITKKERKERRENPWKPLAPNPLIPPIDLTPKIPLVYTDNTSGEYCLVREFFKQNPNGICMVSCSCRNCNPYYLTF